MQLFSDSELRSHQPQSNVLPYDGAVYYHGPIVERAIADTFYQRLRTGIAWEHDQAQMFGKRIITKRKVAWYADVPFEYTYSKMTKTALPWTADLLELKQLAETTSKATYNSCLLNLYHSGEEGMAWHSDDERDLADGAPIASLTFGAERKFAFKHKQSKEKVALYLAHGSLLIMTGTTQTNWLHRLPPTKKVQEPRINLTFRTMLA